MRRRTARLVLAVLVLSVLLVMAASTSAVTPPSAIADRPALTLCVEDTTRIPEAVRAAVSELDSLDEVAATYHRGVGCTPSAPRVIRARQATLPPATGGYATPDSVVLNRAGRFATFDGHERYMAVLHELMHIVLSKPHGPGWDQHNGHVHRCDSVLADRSSCIFQLDGLTDYDREQIAQRYRG